MSGKVYVVGVGMTKFEKPGRREWDYPDMAKEAGTNALTDAGIAYEEIEQVAVGYCYGDSTAGQRALYEIGVSGVPVVNVNNNCATGSSALYLAKRFIEGGGLLFSDDCNHDIAGLYAVSFEQEMRQLFPGPRTLEKLPNSHPLYRSFFPFPDGPPQTAHELNDRYKIGRAHV